MRGCRRADGHGRARFGVAVVILAFAGVVLAACGLLEKSELKSAPTITDRLRTLDLLPRNLEQREAATSTSSSRTQPQVYGPGNPAPVIAMGNAPAQAQPNGEGYDLNFENAPVATLAKVIIGDILGKGYTIDARVQGTVNLSSGRPVTKAEALYVLENALRMDNVALLRDPTGYRLVPAPEALGGTSVDKTATTEPGFGISIVPLRYVSAQNMLKLLDGFAVRPGAVRVDAGRNLVLIQGTGTERRNAINTVLSFDADWMRGQSVGIFRSATARLSRSSPRLKGSWTPAKAGSARTWSSSSRSPA